MPGVPEDAGEYSEGLQAILDRIPDKWGKYISCSKGWYPILVELDKNLAILNPDYEIHQVKEKFGGLRYYTDFSYSKDKGAIELISEAERQTFVTCEACGSTEEARVVSNSRRYLRTLCKICEINMDEPRYVWGTEYGWGTVSDE